MSSEQRAAAVHSPSMNGTPRQRRITGEQDVETVPESGS